MASFDSMIRQRVDIIPNENEGNDLRKQYNQNKMGWVYDDGTKVPPLTKEEKKELKLFLTDQLEFRYTTLCKLVFRNVKKIRSKNPQRNAIDDLLDLNAILDMDNRLNPNPTLPHTLTNHIKTYCHGWDVNEGITKDCYKVRNNWGGVK